MIARLMVTMVILGGLGLFWIGWQQAKRRLVASIQPVASGSEKPTLLYFSADYCAPCKFQQAPIVRQVSDTLNDAITVQTIDVTRQPELAKRYKVLTLPTTIVIDKFGRVTYMNHGVTAAHTLKAQLAG